MVKFIEYTGGYPNLCSGILVLEIDGKTEEIDGLCSGGAVWFDEKWDDHVEEGRWSVDVPEHLIQHKGEIEDCVNENVPWGCCGGCI